MNAANAFLATMLTDQKTRQIVNCLLGDLFKAIDDLDITPDEIWKGVYDFNKLGQDAKRPCSRPVSACRNTWTSAWMRPTAKRTSTAPPPPRTIEGPLYVAGAPVRDGVSRLDVNPDKDAGAVIECWHANSKGFYSHFDPTGAQSDFNLRGAVRAGADGKYEFRTLMPVGYGCPPHSATASTVAVVATGAVLPGATLLPPWHAASSAAVPRSDPGREKRSMMSRCRY